MRRSQGFKNLDLRKVIDHFSIENGGGHPGAIGFRIDRDLIESIDEYVNLLISGTEVLIKG
jgi:nanoRNase/pAp phosphatase (c-di-AMP/oligoRNAs hydrolase)